MKNDKRRSRGIGIQSDDEGPESGLHDEDQEDLTGLKINKSKIIDDHDDSDQSPD